MMLIKFQARPHRDDEWNRVARGEEPLQRADRNFVELLQELRVMQTGVQILFALLLTVAFTGAFADADAFQRTVYVATLLCCAVATALLMAPVAYHRTMFQRGRKAELVVAAHRLLRLGLAVIVAAVVGSLLLVVDEAVSRPAGFVVSGVAGAVFVALWFVLPARSRRAGTSPPLSGGPPPEPEDDLLDTARHG
ncbi:MAG: DUF6328 family protein [Pseudonocardiaceae bacterium]